MEETVSVFPDSWVNILSFPTESFGRDTICPSKAAGRGLIPSLRTVGKWTSSREKAWVY
jgi:hypothetical protein